MQGSANSKDAAGTNSISMALAAGYGYGSNHMGLAANQNGLPSKKGKFDPNMNPAATAQGFGNAMFPVASSHAVESHLSQMLVSIQRMEQVACYTTGPPKLPSPLAEMHRIMIGGMLDDSTNVQLLTPFYNKCLAAFMRVAQEQADNCTSAGLLPGVLEGLELLMQHNHEDENMKKGIQYTYTYVLKAYIKLIEPQVKLNHNV
jgi:hypothetical protein